MKLESVDIQPSPRTPDTVRLQASVRLQSVEGGGGEVLWFDFPARYEEQLTRSGNPWLAALLPWAAMRNERLEIDAPVDPVLVENARKILGVWRSWPGRRGHLELHCPHEERSARRTETVALFTGGVDSFYTVLHPPSEITRLVTIHGFDIPLADTDSFRRVLDGAKTVGAEIGAEVIPVATNLLESAWEEADYVRLGHGAALLSIPLALSPRLVLLASSHYKSLVPWGSHPHTDPLFSTSTTEVVHHGLDRSRVAKTEAIASFETAMRHLRVCWESRSDKNCGSCEKCYRTMLTLHLLGALDRCTTFPPYALDLGRISRIYAGHHAARLFAREVRALAARVGNRRVEQDLTAALKRSRRIRRTIYALQVIPFLRLGTHLERSVRRRSVS